MTAMSEDGVPGHDRWSRRARRRYAAGCADIAAVLLIGGFLLARALGGGWHDVGVTAVGYGIGVAVAAAFLASGYEPRKRR
jgi:hypothetical protein